MFFPSCWCTGDLLHTILSDLLAHFVTKSRIFVCMAVLPTFRGDRGFNGNRTAAPQRLMGCQTHIQWAAGIIAVQRSECVPQCSPQTQAAFTGDMWCFTLMIMRLILYLQRVGCCVSFYLVHDCTNAIWLRLQINKCAVQEEDIKREHTNSRNQSQGNKQRSGSLKTRICIKKRLFACVVVRWPVLFPCLVWSACWDFPSRLNRTEQVEDDFLVWCTQPLLS